MLSRPTLSLPTLTLLLVSLFTLAYFWLTHAGIYDYDDYTYARYAHQLATGTFDPAPPVGSPDHTPLHGRLLVFGPVAVCYWLFGLTSLTSTLWPLFCTLGAAALCFGLYHQRAPLVAGAGLLLLGLHYFHLNLSNYLYPDNILLFLAFASAAALLRGRSAPQHATWWGAGFALLNLAALLSKETIVYYLPFYLLLLARDLRYRRRQRFWKAALLTGVALLGAYGGYYYLVAHDALFPLRVVEHANEKLKARTYAGGQLQLLARVTWQPLALIIGTGLAPAWLLALVAARRHRQLPREARFWLGLTGSAWLFYWVGSTSLVYYNPNSLVPRMLSPLLPPLCVAAGFGVQWLVRTGRDYAWVGAGLLLSAWWLHDRIGLVYGLLGTSLLGMALWMRYGRPLGLGARARLTLAVLGISLAIRPLYFMQKPNLSGFHAQYQLLHRPLAGPHGAVVLADDFLLANYPFSYGFDVPSTLRFLPYASADTLALRAGRPTWLLLNRRTLANPELRPHVISYSAAQVLVRFPNRRLVAQLSGVELYALDDVP